MLADGLPPTFTFTIYFWTQATRLRIGVEEKSKLEDDHFEIHSTKSKECESEDQKVHSCQNICTVICFRDYILQVEAVLFNGTVIFRPAQGINPPVHHRPINLPIGLIHRFLFFP